MPNYKTESGESQLTLPLFVPGFQGWLNPQPHIVLKVEKNLDTLTTKQLQERLGIPKRELCPIDGVVPWQVYLLWHQGRDCWAVYKKVGKNLDTLTTKQLQERLNIRDRDLCPINGVVPWQVYLLWHQGRDRWILYKKVAF